VTLEHPRRRRIYDSTARRLREDRRLDVSFSMEVGMEIPLQIAFKDLDSSTFIETLIRERAARMERLHPHIISCRVVVQTPYRSPESGKPPIGVSVEVEVPGKRHKLIGKDEQERHEVKNDQYAMITRAFDAVERQLKNDAEIKRGAVKHHEGAGETGRVVRLFPEQNYGFIEVRGSTDLYFTRNAVIGGSFDDLDIGLMVEVSRATMEGPMGPQASSVKLLNAGRSPTGNA
jgi:ribosome-associated translation inhibitor RaiA/cold shock CspA family protein